jgi:hypothetical protein
MCCKQIQRLFAHFGSRGMSDSCISTPTCHIFRNLRLLVGTVNLLAQPDCQRPTKTIVIYESLTFVHSFRFPHSSTANQLCLTYTFSTYILYYRFKIPYTPETTTSSTWTTSPYDMVHAIVCAGVCVEDPIIYP